MNSGPTSEPSHYPVLHLRPRTNWVNDPNGLVYHDDAYHVFFQFNPDSARHANMRWGHFVSRDLLNWQLLPVAIAPTPGGLDRDGVWSGNAVTVKEELLAVYSAKDNSRFDQPIVAARSRDGVTFTKESQPLIATAPDGVSMFRDPYVWLDGTRWRMLVGAALNTGRGAALHYATDEADPVLGWRYEGVLLAAEPVALPGGRNSGPGWECVQYVALLQGRAALLVSA